MKTAASHHQKQKFSVTAVIIEDADDKGYTGFFEEFPQAVAEGDTEDELMENLFEALSVLGRMNKQEVENDFMPKVQYAFGSVSKRSMELEFA